MTAESRAQAEKYNAEGHRFTAQILRNRKQRMKLCYIVMQDVNHQLFTESVLDEILLSLDNPDKEQDACRIEHVVSDESFQKLREILSKME